MATPHVSDIQVHTKSRMVTFRFDDGAQFDLPCEYLRVFSQAAEVRTAPYPVTGKETVGITEIQPQGQYAIRIVFDDGHDTGIYSWQRLYDLGRHYHDYWQHYLARLDEIGYQRSTPESVSKHLTLLYFSWLAHQLRRSVEQVTVPEQVQDVTGLITWLQQRRSETAVLFQLSHLRVTVNRQFAEPFTHLHDQDEVAFVPNTPIAIDILSRR
jgi:DUF971 family protein/molybdopterin converting factor small subunit